jgi:hypothetical protein
MPPAKAEQIARGLNWLGQSYAEAGMARDAGRATSRDAGRAISRDAARAISRDAARDSQWSIT